MTRTIGTPIEERVYVGTSGFFGYSVPVRVALEAFPSTQLLVGTDASYEPRTPDEARQFAGAIANGNSTGDADRILTKSALELLG